MHARYGRPIFDPTAKFVVRNGPLTVNGTVFNNGTLVNKALLSARRLALLFEQRKLEIDLTPSVVTPVARAPVPVAKSTAVAKA
jgi:hypothetical protein